MALSMDDLIASRKQYKNMDPADFRAQHMVSEEPFVNKVRRLKKAMIGNPLAKVESADIEATLARLATLEHLVSVLMQAKVEDPTVEYELQELIRMQHAPIEDFKGSFTL